MASTRLRIALAGTSVVVVTAAGTVAVRATDPCWCIQSIVSPTNREALSAAEVLGGAKDGEVILYVACGEGEGEGAALPDTQVIGACGTRGVLASGTGYVGKTATELQATGRWSGRVGIGYRCAPDADRPGMLNAACNTECALCYDLTDAGKKQRARLLTLGAAFDCSAWIAAGGDCRPGVP